MRYVDEGHGAPLVFVHGTPSWSFEYRRLIARFSGRFRCLALDHLGFGLSDKPPRADYRLQAHAGRFTAWLEALTSGPVSLVVHDVGGPIALAWALSHPQRVERLVVMNSWCWDFSGHPRMRRMRPLLTSPLTAWLYRRANASPRWLLPAAFADRRRLGQELHRQYRQAFAKPWEREAPLAVARALVREQAFFASLWDVRQRLAHVPALLLWGQADPLLPPDFADAWQEGFPQMRVSRLASCGHFPTEEAPEAVGEALEAFL
jgi:haloalkane dehalogenase